MKENLNLQPFYVGEKIKYIGNRSDLSKDVTYIVFALEKLSCGCWGVDVGVKCSEISNIFCRKHKCNVLKDQVIAWEDSLNFKSLNGNFRKISLSKVIERETELVSSN